MRTLAIETATQACSVALFDGDDLLAGEHVVLGRGHAERLVPMIEALPDKGRADRILVSLGPGSFTGVRIGIATARALGIAWGAQVLGYTTMALIATQSWQSDPQPVTVCMHGGHGEWFVQNFADTAHAEDEVRSLAPDNAMEAARHRVIAGNRAQELAELLGDERIVIDLLPDARETAKLDDAWLLPDLAPIYGRGPDAKLPVK